MAESTTSIEARPSPQHETVRQWFCREVMPTYTDLRIAVASAPLPVEFDAVAWRGWRSGRQDLVIMVQPTIADVRRLLRLLLHELAHCLFGLFPRQGDREDRGRCEDLAEEWAAAQLPRWLPRLESMTCRKR